MKKILFVIHFFAIALVTTAQSKVNLTIGQKIASVSGMKIETSMNMGMQMDIVNDMTIKSSMGVMKENKENYEVALNITAMKIAVSGAGQSMNFDSENPDDMKSEAAGEMAGKLNKPMTFFLDKKTGKATPADSAMLKGADNPFASGADPNQVMGDLIFALPANAKVGDTWKDSTVSDGLKSYNTNKIISLNNGVAVVEVTSILDGEKDVDIQGMSSKMTMKTNSISKVTVNSKSSVVLSKEISSDTDASMDIMGNTVPMTIKVTGNVAN